MCGIAGFIGKGDKEVLRKMIGTLKHRGPDEEGFFVKNNVHLGHSRLSIIDLATGRQPIFNEDKSICVVFNGEIYNFQILRRTLKQQGHKFSTQSDTEVIVHLYEARGEEFLKELNGMFAMALFDEKLGKLILARDRLGQKPLYYSCFKNNLIFASELKAILAHCQVKKELDFFSLAKYLSYEYVPAPRTIFRNINKLGPGEYLVYQKNNLEKRKYWDVRFAPENQTSKLSEKEILQELGEELERAVSMRLVADVPLGVWLSGGIDSTAIAYFAQKNSSEPVKTFSIGFGDSSFDESKYARQAAQFLGTEHHEEILESKDCLNLIPQIIDFLDEPLADASLVPTFLLSRFTRQSVKVALGGDGGDELFMGYPTFQAHRLAKIYGNIPAFIRKNIINSAIDCLPTSFKNISLDFKLKKFISGFDYSPEVRDQIWMGSFCPQDFTKLFSPEIYKQIQSNNVFEDIEHRLKAVSGQSLENRLIYLYLKHYLQDDILVKTDRSSMALGLEVRAPLLDHQLVEFVNSVPSRFKLKGLTTKYLFKKLMKDKVPENIVYRSKKGFGIPIALWLRKELKDFALEIFSPSKIKKQGIFNYSYINQLLQEHFSGQKDHRKPLWTLMVFEMWHERWA